MLQQTLNSLDSFNFAAFNEFWNGGNKDVFDNLSY